MVQSKLEKMEVVGRNPTNFSTLGTWFPICESGLGISSIRFRASPPIADPFHYPLCLTALDFYQSEARNEVFLRRRMVLISSSKTGERKI